MDEDQIEQRLESIVEGTNKDLDWAWSKYYEKLEEAKETAADRVTEAQLASGVLSSVSGSIIQGSRSGGPVEDVKILSIGHNGVQKWSDGDDGKKEVLVAFGIVNPVDEDKPMQMANIVCDETDGVDVHNLKKQFRTLNTLEGKFQISEADDLSNVYNLQSSEDTKVEEEESDMSEEEKREHLNRFVDDHVSLDSIAEYMSTTNSDGYLAARGADMRRITATVVDWYSGDGFNTYTVIDESTLGGDNLNPDAISDQGRTPGLTVWCADEFFKYGCDSLLEIYGPISRNDDGQISMQAVGISPLTQVEMDESQQTSGDSTNDSNVDEEMI